MSVLVLAFADVINIRKNGADHLRSVFVNELLRII